MRYYFRHREYWSEQKTKPATLVLTLNRRRHSKNFQGSNKCHVKPGRGTMNTRLGRNVILNQWSGKASLSKDLREVKEKAMNIFRRHNMYLHLIPVSSSCFIFACISLLSPEPSGSIPPKVNQSPIIEKFIFNKLRERKRSGSLIESINPPVFRALSEVPSTYNSWAFMGLWYGLVCTFSFWG